MRCLALLTVMTFSFSCSQLQDAIKLPYEIGKYEGRKEAQEDLKKNKKDLEELAKVLGYSLVDLSVDGMKDAQLLIPQALLLYQLLNQREEIKKALVELSE